MSVILLVLCIATPVSILYGQAPNQSSQLKCVQLNGTEDYLPIHSYAELLKDVEQDQLDWSDVILLSDTLFKPNTDFERGKEIQWLRMGLENDTNKPMEYMLWLYHNIDYANLYMVNEENELVSAAYSGALVKLKDRPFQGYNQSDVQFPLTIAPGKFRLYIRTNNIRKLTQDHLKIGRLLLIGESKFDTLFKTSAFTDGIFYGAGMLFVLLSLVLYLINRERLFIETLFILLMSLLYPFTFSGYLIAYVLYDQPGWALYLEYFFGVSFGVTFLLVSVIYLNTKKTVPKIRKYIYALALVTVILFIPSLLNIYIYKILITIIPAGLILILPSLYYSLKLKHRLSYYYGMTVLFGSFIMFWFVMNQLGFTSNETYMTHDYSLILIPGIGLFLLFGLFDHFYINKKQQLENELENEQAIRKIETEKNNLVRQQNVILEKKVKERTAEIVEKNKQLEALDKMKSSFFANISHEFRTPLTLIIGPAKSQLKLPENDSQSTKNLETILANANQLLDLINQLLDLAKSENGQLDLEHSQIDIKHFLFKQVQPFSALAETKQIQFILQGIESFVITIDIQKFSRIFDNIIYNALKFSPRDSEVTINAYVENENCLIEIIDQGAGIPDSEKENVFKRFYQLNNKDTNVGSGIGLALAKEYVLLHGGNIHVENNTPMGSKFVIQIPTNISKGKNNETVPLADVLKENSLVQQPEFQIKNGQTLDVQENEFSILIVEDNSGVRDFIRSSFDEEYRVYEAVNGQEGIVLANKIIPDLIISDVMMPGMDGISMTTKLKNDMLTSHIPIILLTAKASLEHKVEGLNTGADDYLTKPFESEELVARVKTLISNRVKLREKYSEGLISNQKGKHLPLIEQRFITLAEDHILENIKQEAYDVNQLSEALKIERSTLYRKLKALTGMTPTLFIRTIRLKKAMELLKTEQLTISEIAFAVGFGSSQYFSKMFKLQYGQSPSEITSV